MVRDARCLSLLALVWVAPHVRADDLSAVLDALLNPLAQERITCSAVVVDAATGATLYAFNADESLIPASNAKLFVMAAALDALGPDFAFKTVLARCGNDLVVIGSGDPAFGDPRIAQARGQGVTEPFQRWADAMQGLGAQVVPGDLILDESIFEKCWVHPNWKKQDLIKWYAAPIGALNLNDNCLDITLHPASKGSGTPDWEFVPPNRIAEIDYSPKAVKGGPILDWVGPGFQYRVTGRSKGPWTFGPVAIPDPGALFADSFMTVLSQRGLKVMGGVRRVFEQVDWAGAGLIPLADHVTPLADVLARIGKDSQNMFAESLAKRLGYEWAKGRGLPSPQGSWATARQAVQSFIDKLARSDHAAIRATRWDTLVWDDASGLSRQNRCSARQLAALLAYMTVHPYSRQFTESLSIAGVDGSLSKRAQLNSLTGALVGKTGTLSGVRSLSGYITPISGGQLAFAIMVNQHDGQAKTSLSTVVERFARILHDSTGSP